MQGPSAASFGLGKAVARRPVTYALDMAGYFPSSPLPPGSSSVALQTSAWLQRSGPHEGRAGVALPRGGAGVWAVPSLRARTGDSLRCLGTESGAGSVPSRPRGSI